METLTSSLPGKTNTSWPMMAALTIVESEDMIMFYYYDRILDQRSASNPPKERLNDNETQHGSGTTLQPPNGCGSVGAGTTGDPTL